MTQEDRDRNRNRLVAGTAVTALHALLLYAFLTGLAVQVATSIADDLKVFDVPTEPPPPLRSDPAKLRAPDEEGAASAPSLKAKPTPIIAPQPKVRLEVPSPVVTAPEPTPVEPGHERSAGASNIDGPGTGTGGEGAGTGAGGRGSGTGGGGGGVAARRVSGAISGDRDYPRAARRAGVEGSVAVRFTVGTDGSVSGCRILRSSGHAELDETTCRLIERRFRYEPARDEQGRLVPEIVSRTFDWMLPYRQ